VESPRPAGEPETPLPTNWREALLTLVASRVSLIQLESKQAAKDGASRLARLIAVVICLFFCWALALAGGIAAISQATGTAWFRIAMIAAAIHLAAAILLALSAKGRSTPAFSVTRAEFQKDREWIENFQKHKKSNG
jgi:uncharacterized membrane protein YqjE